jgi:antitoxin CcdA
MDRIKVNLTLDAELAATARAIAEATKAERNRLWREETRAAHAAYAQEVAREGLSLAAFRTF